MAINFFNSLAVGTNVLYVDAINDRVGIGTSSPDTGTNLHVLTGTGSGQIKLSSQANTQFQFYGDGNQDINYGRPANFPDPGGSAIGQIRYSHGSNYMAFKVNNAEMVRFASNNYVGIGTTSPGAKLDVAGDVKIGSFGTNTAEFALGTTISNKVFSYGAEFQTNSSDIQVVLGRNNGTSVQGTGGIGASGTNAFHVYDTTSITKLFEVAQTSGNATFAGNVTADRYYGNGSTVYYIDPNDSTTSAILNGNVGIGTTSPSFPLHVRKDSGTYEIITIQNNTSAALFRAIGNGGGTVDFGAEVGTANTAIIRTGGTERLRIGSAGQIGIGGANYGTSGQVLTSNGSGSAPSWQNAGAASSNWTLSGNDIYNNNSGNVGIGTSSPDQKLHVHKASAGTVSSNSNAIITAENNANGYIHLLVPDANESGILFGNPSSSVNGAIVYNNSGTSNGLQFRTSGNSTKMVIDSSGNVGIGTTSPDFLLSTSGTGTNRISVNSTNSGTSGVYFRVLSGGSMIGNGTIATQSNGDMKFFTGTSSESEKMIITSGGNVGIGTTSPGYKLEVNGTAKADEFVSLVNTSNYGITRDWTIIGTGNVGAALEINDISGAKYAIYAGGYDLTFSKHVSSSNGYTTAMGIYAASATDSAPYVQATHSFRAPIFYDSNNTGYYVDPASTSVTNAMQANSYLVNGTYDGNFGYTSMSWNGSTNYPTLFSSDADRWIMHIKPHIVWTQNGQRGYTGTTEGSVVRYEGNLAGSVYWDSGCLTDIASGGDYWGVTRSGTWAFYADPSRNLHAATSMRAPIFYDSNNTGYYLDPNTTATSLNTAGSARIRNIDISPSSAADTIQNKTSGGNLWLQYGHNGPVGLGYGGGLTTAYNGLHVYARGAGWDDGLNLYSNDVTNKWNLLVDNGAADHLRFAFNSSEKARLQTDGALISYGQFINNGNGFKSLNNKGMVGDYDTNGTATKIIWTIGDSWNSTGNMYGLAYEYNSTYAHHLAFKENGTTYQRIGFGNAGADFTGTVKSNTDFRAPIFYDTNNTARYIDPSSTSRINRLEIENTSDQSTPTAYMQIGSDGFQFGGNNNGYETNSAQISAGYHVAGSLNFVGMGTSSSNRRMDFWAEGGFFVSGTIYDKDSTSYYLDPGATGTSLNVAGKIVGSNINSSIKHLGDGVSYDNDRTQKVSNGIAIYSGYSTGSNRPFTYDLSMQVNGNNKAFEIAADWISGSSTRLKVRSLRDCCQNWSSWTDIATSGSSFTNSVDLRSPIFYDSNDTTYYVNPASQSILSTAKFLGVVANGSPVGDATIGRNHAYNTMELKGYGQEMMIGSQGTALHINYRTCNNGVSGHTPTSWYWRAGSSTSYSDHYMGLIQSSSSMRAPIFYDTDDTSYYVDPRSISVLSRVELGTGISGAPSFTRLKIKGSGNGGCALFVEGAGYTSNVKMTLPTYGAGIYIDNVGALGVNALYFARNGTNAGEIVVNTGLTTNYNTTSDYRLKENVVKLTNGIEKVKQLKPKRFNFILDENKEIIDGFIAHEAKEVVPGSVTGEKDGVLPNGDPDYQGMDNSKLVPVLTAALQEAIAKIEDLETRIQILENQ